MTEKEAALIRTNGSKLYSRVKVAFYAICTHLGQQCGIPDDSIKKYVEAAWDATKLDDAFHDLGSTGYKALIEEGWNPFTVSDPNDWQPSPDCVDYPTTRGGAD